MTFYPVVFWTSLFCILLCIAFALEAAEVLRRGTLWTKFSGLKARILLTRSLWLTSGFGLVVLVYLVFLGSQSLGVGSTSLELLIFAEKNFNSIKLLLFILSVFLIQHIFVCREFRGRLSGGSDALLFHIFLGLILSLIGSIFSTTLGPKFQLVGLFWIASQVTISYFVAGAVKARHRRWWTGDVLSEVLQSSIYSIPPWLRQLSKYPEVLQKLAALIIVFELSFPLVWVFPDTVYFYLGLGFLFHFGVWMMFGLHRFFWVWICSYPPLLFSIQNLNQNL